MARYDPLPYVREPRRRDLRLADLYLRQGEDQADAERRSGEISANLWGGVGQAVGQAASALIEAPNKKREQDRLEAESRQRRELGDIQIGNARREVNDRENFDLAMTAGSRQKTLEALKDRPELYEKAQGHFAKIDAGLKQLLTSAAEGIADFGYTPEAANAALDDLEENGFDANKLKPYREAFKSPEQIKSIVDRMLGIQPKLEPGFELGPGQTRFDAQGKPIASVPANAPAAPNPTETSLALKATAGDPEAVKALALIRGQRPEPQGPAPERKSVLISKGTQQRYVTPAEADAMLQQGWVSGQTRENPTEDERKAAGWLQQAQKAFDNMEAALGEDPNADEVGFVEKYSPIEEVGNRSRSAARQKYSQAASSFAEAALRAATGAGVNKDEAAQKIQEITPQRGDDPSLREQKRAGRKMYLDSLRLRSGRALSQGPASTPSDSRVYYDANGNPVKKP